MIAWVANRPQLTDKVKTKTHLKSRERKKGKPLGESDVWGVMRW